MNKNPLGIKRFGPVVMYVHDAAFEAHRLAQLLAMKVAYSPAEEDGAVYGIAANDVLFIFDSSPAAAALADRYGNHVAEIGLMVHDSQRALRHIRSHSAAPTRECLATGATLVSAPHDGGVSFRFSEDGQLPYPGLKPVELRQPGPQPLFSRIDHIVTNTPRIEPMVTFLREAFGMERVNEFTIRVENEQFVASLYSEVMGLYGSEAPVLFPLNEPLAGDTESQIPSQLRAVGRSHQQHIALAATDIIQCITELRAHGLAFLDFRNAEHARCYYQQVPQRLGDIPLHEALDELRQRGILVDKCGDGYLLQLFSKRLFPDLSVPFLEIIQRASDVIGCFGDGNFAALAESLEHSLRSEGGPAATPPPPATPHGADHLLKK
jgi:4-hydroxyphenylpyruvate dioxygenase